MNNARPLTDERTAFVFLAGIDAHRDEAAHHLAHSFTARELLCMAQEALDALHPISAPPSPTPEKQQAEA